MTKYWKTYQHFTVTLCMVALLSVFQGYWLSTAVAAPDQRATEPGGSKKLDDVTGGKFAGDPIFVHLSPIILPVIDEKGTEQIVTIVIDLEVKDVDVADNIHTIMPRVRDTLMQALYGGLTSKDLSGGKVVNITSIKNKAMIALTDLVGPNNLRDVLVQGVAQRML